MCQRHNQSKSQRRFFLILSDIYPGRTCIIVQQYCPTWRSRGALERASGACEQGEVREPTQRKLRAQRPSEFSISLLRVWDGIDALASGSISVALYNIHLGCASFNSLPPTVCVRLHILT